MKNIYTLFLGLIITGSLMAQAPQSFKYQAVARDAGGDVVAGQAVGMQISILQGNTGGIIVYVETFTPTTNEFGLINLNIGAGTMVNGDFTTIDWSADTYFIKVEMDITGGTTYEEYGTSQLLSVPYAMHAKTAANTFSGNYNDLSGAPINVSTFTNDAGYLTSFTETDPTYTASEAANITATDITNLGNLSGENTGDQDLSTLALKSNVIELDNTTAFTPDADYEPATKKYVDDNADETDPVFTAWDKSYNDLTNKPDIIDSINAVVDTTTQFVRTEVDGDVANEIQDLLNVLAQGNNAGGNNITNLADPINDQDAATKAYIDQMKAEIFTQIAGGKVTDYDGNSYKTVKIGDQVWMAENLKVTHYRNGDLIPNVTDSAEWSNLTTGARCYYDNDFETYAGTYGALYNWYTVVDSRNLCPTGWHVPSDAEWTTLETYLGGSSVAAGKMKETGTIHWRIPNTGATNESGFTALPGGYRHYDDGTFAYIVDFGYWWSSSEEDISNAWYRRVLYISEDVIRYWHHKKHGFSVRCLRD